MDLAHQCNWLPNKTLGGNPTLLLSKSHEVGILPMVLVLCLSKVSKYITTFGGFTGPKVSTYWSGPSGGALGALNPQSALHLAGNAHARHGDRGLHKL